jgi:hypothetical protein
MIEKALSESALLFGNTNKVFASFERTPNLFVPEKMSSSFPISPQNCNHNMHHLRYDHCD